MTWSEFRRHLKDIGIATVRYPCYYFLRYVCRVRPRRRPRWCGTLSRQEVYERRKAVLPKPLPLERRRLSTSYDPVINKDSYLLRRLPLELRRRIYSYVLGGNLLHLVMVPNRVTHICCTSDTRTRPLHTCCREVVKSFFIPMPFDAPQSPISLALLRSCRQVYSEAVSILYSDNTFEVVDMGTLWYFSQAIPSQHFAAIRRLHFCWVMICLPFEHPSTKDPILEPDDDASYLRFWHLVATKMPGLTELRILILNPWWVRRITMDDSWVGPLKEVRGLRSFELDLEPRRDGLPGYWDLAEMDDFRKDLKLSMCRAR